MINIWLETRHSTLTRVVLTENRGTTFLVGPFLGPAIAGYISAGSDWRTSFGVLTAIYGVSTAMVILFGYETYHEPGRTIKQSRLASYFGIGNTMLPKGSTLRYWSRTVVVYVFKFPLLMIGGYGRHSLR